MKYGGLNSIDVAKIHRYRLNLSNVKVGLGYEFSGVVTNVGPIIRLNLLKVMWFMD